MVRALAIVGILLSAASSARAIEVGSITVKLEQFGQANFDSTTGFPGFKNIPLDMVPLDDGTGRLAANLFGGDVRLLSSSGQVLDGGSGSPYFSGNSSATGSFGSTGIAVHPDFATNGKIYQLITDTASGTADFGTGSNHHDLLLEWSIQDTGAVGLADDIASNTPTFVSREVLRIAQPGDDHNVWDLAFGNDDFLYISLGDGGHGGTTKQDAQDLTKIYGSLLRIDPVNTSGAGLITSANGQYGIPTANIGAINNGSTGSINEIYAFGLRSPFRFNFDRDTGKLYLGDVGAGLVEEIDLVSAGGNYGWGRFEGTTLIDGGVTLTTENGTVTGPSFEYGRSEGETVVGGFVYRGSDITELQGKYVFADFGRQVTSGQKGSPVRLFYADLDVDGNIIGSSVREFGIDSSGVPLVLDNPADALMVNGQSFTFIFSIAEDINGELYLLVGDDPGFPAALNFDGRILRITAVPEPTGISLLVTALLGIASVRWGRREVGV